MRDSGRLSWETAVAEWRKLVTDPGATFDRELTIPALEDTR